MPTNDSDMMLMFIGLLWWTALIAELAYRNGYRNGLPAYETFEGSGLPKKDTPVVVINRDSDLNTNAFLVKPEYILNRKPVGSRGTYLGYVPGADGDLWWVTHDDGSIAAYSYTEMGKVIDSEKCPDCKHQWYMHDAPNHVSTGCQESMGFWLECGCRNTKPLGNPVL